MAYLLNLITSTFVKTYSTGQVYNYESICVSKMNAKTVQNFKPATTL